MVILLEIFSEAEEPELIENKWNALGRERGVAIRHLKVQMCPGGIA
jgi:hypothetical protein